MIVSLAEVPVARIREVARQILDRPEYARWRVVHWEELELWLKQQLEWILDFLSGTADVSPLVYLLFWSTLLIISGLLTIHVVWTLRAAFAVTPPPPSSGASQAAIDLSEQAAALARQQRFLEASHCLYLACLDLLLQRGMVKLSRSDPNRTLRRLVRQSPLSRDDAEMLCGLVDRMETSWFRSGGDEPDLYDKWRSLLLRLQASLATR